MQALSHAAGIISSLLPGCAEPPSPPKSARLYRPAFGMDGHHGPTDGVEHPSPPGATCCEMNSPDPLMRSANSNPRPQSSDSGLAYPENCASYSNYGAGVRAANAMLAAHTAYLISDLTPSMGWKGGCGANQTAETTGAAMHAMMGGGRSMWDESKSMQLPETKTIPLQPQWESQSMPLPPYQGSSGW